MPYTTSSANALIRLILQGDAIATLANNATSSPLTNLYLGLYTSAPGAAGTQATNEISYTGYARRLVARNGTGWTVSGNEGALAAALEFGEMTAGAGGTVTHIGLGTLVSGAGLLLVYGALNTSIPVQVGVVPRLRAGTKVNFLVA